MKKTIICLIAGLLSACTSGPQISPYQPERETPKPVINPVAVTPQHTCVKTNSLAIKTRPFYDDYYGTVLTSSRTLLNSGAKEYKWGITNAKPIDMAYFAAYVKSDGKFKHFKTSLYIDQSITAPMIFMFRNGDWKGEVIDSFNVNPGETVDVELEVVGVKKLYIGSELRINHGVAKRLIMGEPEFYNCK